MAERLGRLAGDKPSPEPATPPPSQPSVPCDPPIPPFQGHHLGMINSGSSNEQLREYTKAVAKYRKRIPSLICHLSNQPLGCPPGTRVHQVGDGDILDCACKFAREFQA